MAVLAMPAAAQLSGRPIRPQVTRPEGAVWNVIRRNCTACHGIDDYAFFALDKPGWQALIESKHKAGDFSLANEDRNILLDWLAVKFGPNAKPFPRSYVPLRSRHFSPIQKPRDFSIARALPVTSWIAWKRRGIPRSGGGY